MLIKLIHYINCITLLLTACCTCSFAAAKDSVIVFSGSLIGTSVEQITEDKYPNAGIGMLGCFYVTQTYQVIEQYTGERVEDTLSVRFWTEFKNEPHEFFSRKALVVAKFVENGVFVIGTGYGDSSILPLVQTKDGALVAICDEDLTRRYPVFKAGGDGPDNTAKVGVIRAERLADYIIHAELYPEPNVPLLTDVEKERAKDHGYVDLGLSVLWATCNLGADSEYESGSYFSWGETQEKGSYTRDNYKWSPKGGVVTKYDTTCTLDIEDDAARYWWGDAWRIPTSQEIIEICENCTWTRLEDNSGYIGVSKINGRSIVFPMTGRYEEDQLEHKGKRSAYSAYYMSSEGNCGRMDVMDVMDVMYDTYPRSSTISYYGFCIRPVRSR